MKIKFHPEFFNDMKRLFSSNPIYAVPRFFRDARFEIQMAWQRVFRGYDDKWGWGFYSELNAVAPLALKQMIEYGNGHPGHLKDLKEWHGILRKIIKGFEAADGLAENDYFTKVKLDKPEKDFMGDEVDYKLVKNVKLEKKLKAEFDEGMKLFKEYYFNLWD